MKHVAVLKGARISTDWGAKLLKVFTGPVLLAALAAQANAGPVGICILSGAYGGGSVVSTAQYASAAGVGGCAGGFNTSIVTGGSVNPTTLAAGLTAATLTVTQSTNLGGDSVAISTADLGQGILRDFANGRVRATAESVFSDNLHFTVTNASSATLTLHAHLDGQLGLSGNSPNYSILEQFGLGGSGCWGSATGLGFQPCLSQNFGFLTSSFTNQSATGFDFTGTFQVTNGATDPFFAALQIDCSGGATCNFSNTASFSLTLPSNVTFTSDSGVLFTQTSSTPEPATFGVAGAALLCVGALRRRSAKRLG
jgi:hypothetical protein